MKAAIQIHHLAAMFLMASKVENNSVKDKIWIIGFVSAAGPGDYVRRCIQAQEGYAKCNIYRTTLRYFWLNTQLSK